VHPATWQPGSAVPGKCITGILGQGMHTEMRACRTYPDAVPGYVKDTVRSLDGTIIGFRRYGRGPGLILVHGGVQAAQHLAALAAASRISSSWSCRTGGDAGSASWAAPGSGCGTRSRTFRRSSPRPVPASCSGTARARSSRFRTALVTPAAERLALYEPPLSVRGSSRSAWVPRFHREIAAGKNAAAAVTALKGARLDAVLARLPRWLLTPVAAAGMRDRRREPDDVPAADLVPTMRFDVQFAREMADTTADYAALRAPALLIGAQEPEPRCQASTGIAQSSAPKTTKAPDQSLAPG
jgi:hypothetical protein